jgi:hypothetical protein
MRNHDTYDKYDDYHDYNDNGLPSKSPAPSAMEEHAYVESPTYPSVLADDPVDDFSWKVPSKKSKEAKKKAFFSDD